MLSVPLNSPLLVFVKSTKDLSNFWPLGILSDVCEMAACD